MKTSLIAAAALATALTAPAAQAADFSFSGTLNDANQVLFFDFTVGASSTVTLRSYSYAGGTNVNGQTFAGGGFDPILGVYDAISGDRIGENDDGGCGNVPADATTGRCYDTYFQSVLAPGSYRAAVSVFSNFGPDNLFTGSFDNDGDFNGRTNAFAFDVLGVDVATGPGGGVPEPATWALMILGFGAVGGAMRRRRTLSVRYAA